jgi:hypothetical protein
VNCQTIIWATFLLPLVLSSACSSDRDPVITTTPTTSLNNQQPLVSPLPNAVCEVAYDDQSNPFPPALSDTDYHQEGWNEPRCLRCHETGVADAPMVVHLNMSDHLRSAMCRTCHVLIPNEPPHPGAQERALAKDGDDILYDPSAFPPSIPVSGSHTSVWLKDDCRLCHQTGTSGAPQMIHKGLPALTALSKCRTCHVQPRVIQATR